MFRIHTGFEFSFISTYFDLSIKFLIVHIDITPPYVIICKLFYEKVREIERPKNITIKSVSINKC